MTSRFSAILATAGAVLGLGGTALAQRTTTPITAADLRTRLFLIADDSMAGRATGSWGNYQAAEYVASEFRRLGLKPGGENGTWFQTIPFFRQRPDPGGQITANGETFRVGRDFLVVGSATASRSIDGKASVFGGVLADSSTWISAGVANDKVVILAAPAPNFRGLDRLGRFAGAAAIVLPALDAIGAEFVAALLEGRVTTDTTHTGVGPALILMSARAADRLLGTPVAQARPGTPGADVHGQASMVMTPLEYAARNVIGILGGSDPAMAGTYVALTAHNDHVGFDHAPVDHDSLYIYNRVVRPMGADSPPRPPTAAEWVVIHRSIDSVRKIRPARPDSIRNGADDDGSGTVTILEVAEQMAGSAHPRRSVLFVSHAAEEEGLLGSRWFTDHPTVVRDSIVSEFDIDMDARGNKADLPDGGPTYLEMIGMRRLSTEYGDIIEAVNGRQPLPFTFNLTYDAPGHPLQYYCRADHYSYARYDIPAISVSRGEHADYHQVTDEAQYADYDAMERVGRFAADVIMTVANLDHRPRVDFARHDPAARCVQ